MVRALTWKCICPWQSQQTWRLYWNCHAWSPKLGKKEYVYVATFVTVMALGIPTLQKQMKIWDVTKANELEDITALQYSTCLDLKQHCKRSGLRADCKEGMSHPLDVNLCRHKSVSTDQPKVRGEKRPKRSATRKWRMREFPLVFVQQIPIKPPNQWTPKISVHLLATADDHSHNIADWLLSLLLGPLDVLGVKWQIGWFAVILTGHCQPRKMRHLQGLQQLL